MSELRIILWLLNEFDITYNTFAKFISQNIWLTYVTFVIAKLIEGWWRTKKQIVNKERKLFIRLGKLKNGSLDKWFVPSNHMFKCSRYFTLHTYWFHHFLNHHFLNEIPFSCKSKIGNGSICQIPNWNEINRKDNFSNNFGATVPEFVAYTSCSGLENVAARARSP